MITPAQLKTLHVGSEIVFKSHDTRNRRLEPFVVAKIGRLYLTLAQGGRESDVRIEIETGEGSYQRGQMNLYGEFYLSAAHYEHEALRAAVWSDIYKKLSGKVPTQLDDRDLLNIAAKLRTPYSEASTKLVELCERNHSEQAA